MNINELIDQIRDEIRQTETEPDVVSIVTNVLIDEGLDVRREPSLWEMKQILVEAFRAADERRCTTC